MRKFHSTFSFLDLISIKNVSLWCITDPNLFAASPSRNTNNGHPNNGDNLIHFAVDTLPQTVQQSVDQTSGMHQVFNSTFDESIPPRMNGINNAMPMVLPSGNFNAYPMFHYPPPPYDYCLIPSPIPQSQQMLHFPHQNVQYLRQQVLQYPQQESLQYHEELLDDPVQPRRQRNAPLYEPPIKRVSCLDCLTVDTLCCCFCILPLCLLTFLIFYASSSY